VDSDFARFRTLTRQAQQGNNPMKETLLHVLIFCFSFLVTASLSAQETPANPTQSPDQTQSTYKPKFPGDPAHSDSEAAALAYMRVVIRAQKQFNKQRGYYAMSLPDLVHTGSFTKRMVNPQQGDYTVSFKGKKDSYVLTMTPNHMDADHRSFYAEEDGKIHGDAENVADEKSPVVARA
jgi:hypothetical protein